MYLSARSDTLISDSLSKHKGLKVFYHKKEVKDLISSVIFVKNVGNDTVNASDIAPIAPITFITTGKFLLTNEKDYHLIASNKSCSASLSSIDRSNIILDFDFLKPNDQIELTLLHSGTITIHGELRNGEMHISDGSLDQRRRRVNKMKNIIVLVLLFWFIITTICIIVLFLMQLL